MLWYVMAKFLNRDKFLKIMFQLAQILIDLSATSVCRRKIFGNFRKVSVRYLKPVTLKAEAFLAFLTS